MTVRSRVVPVAKRARAAAMTGRAVYCPCCGRSARGFVRGELCVYCNSRARHRFLTYFFADVPVLRPSTRVLHFAPEPCLSEVIGRYGVRSYLTADINPEAAQLPADLTDLDLRSDRFDVVVCSHVLEHIVEDSLALRELFRVLRPGGVALVQIPMSTELERTREDPSVIAPEARFALYGQEDHVRIYGRDVVERLEAPGFLVECHRPEDTVNEVDFERSDLMPSYTDLRGSDVYACVKPTG